MTINQIIRTCAIALLAGLLVYVFLTLLQGCAAPLSPATAEQEQATSIALELWEARFGDVSHCWNISDQIQWHMSATLEDAKTRCKGADACVLHQFDGDIVIVLFDSPDVEQREALFAAELPHWLEWCSGRHPDGDPKHADPEVWPTFERAVRAELRSLRP